MKIYCWAISATTENYLKEGIRQYIARIPHYTSFEYQEIHIKRKNADAREAGKDSIMKMLKPADIVVLLDENGHTFSSTELASWLQQKFNDSSGNLIFIIGGAYGFHPDLIKRANYKISLSRLTFTHQMVRLIFLEQLYRALTIIRNEKYHHEGD